MHFGRSLGPFWLILASFGSIWVPYGSILVVFYPFRSLSVRPRPVRARPVRSTPDFAEHPHIKVQTPPDEGSFRMHPDFLWPGAEILPQAIEIRESIAPGRL